MCVLLNTSTNVNRCVPLPFQVNSFSLFTSKKYNYMTYYCTSSVSTYSNTLCLYVWYYSVLVHTYTYMYMCMLMLHKLYVYMRTRSLNSRHVVHSHSCRVCPLSSLHIPLCVIRQPAEISYLTSVPLFFLWQLLSIYKYISCE